METIPKSDCTCIGYFLKPHGVKGDLVLLFEEKYYDSIETFKWLFIEIDGLLVPFLTAEKGIRIRSGNSAVILLELVDSQDYAKRLSGTKVYCDKKDILINPGEFNPDELVGFNVHGTREGLIGKITEVNNYAGNIVFTVLKDTKEHLLPFNDDLLIKLDTRLKKIVINLPEGLIV
jgi:16S rRNA processing protein RimM